MRRHLQYPLTVETWRRDAGPLARCLLPAAYCLLVVLAGMGLAWLLGVLHKGGITP